MITGDCEADWLGRLGILPVHLPNFYGGSKMYSPVVRPSFNQPQQLFQNRKKAEKIAKAEWKRRKWPRPLADLCCLGYGFFLPRRLVPNGVGGNWNGPIISILLGKEEKTCSGFIKRPK